MRYIGGLAQMVERSLSMREVAGSMPASSKAVLQPLENNVFIVMFRRLETF